MSQNWTDDCFAADHQGLTDLQNIENNLLCLKSNFEGAGEPSNPVKGQSWVDSAASAFFKLRNMANNAWQTVWDFTNDCVAAGKVKTASLADNVLSADAAGRAKMADLFITNAKVNDVDGSKITDNTLPSSKYQNGSVTPSKIAAGGSTLFFWQPTTDTFNAGSPPAVVVGGLTQSYKTILQFYLYIPTGAKYVILTGRIGGDGGGQTVTLRLNVNGTTGGSISVAGSGLRNQASSAFDISGQAGALRTVNVEVTSAAPATSQCMIHFLAVQWYGA